MRWKSLSCIVAMLLLGGCRVQISSPDTGRVVSESSAWGCSATVPCTMDIATTTFDEVFVAEPSPGYQFTGWKRADGYFCGGSLAPCRLVTTGFGPHENLMAVLESDRVFYLEPGFIRDDHVRRYAVGDVVTLAGTLLVSAGGQPDYMTEVSVRFEMLASTLTYRDGPVLLWRTRIQDLTTGELSLRELHIWQAPDGTLLEIADGSGNTLLDADTEAAGLLSVPVPLVPNDYRELYFFTMFGGHTTGPLNQGERSIEVSGSVDLEVPGGVAPVFQITQTERVEYLYTWADFNRGDVVETVRLMSVAPVKGIVAMREAVTELDPQGRFQRRTTLDVRALTTNF